MKSEANLIASRVPPTGRALRKAQLEALLPIMGGVPPGIFDAAVTFDLPTILVALGFVGLLAGFVDAIAGGGGLIARAGAAGGGDPAGRGVRHQQGAVGGGHGRSRDHLLAGKGFVSLRLLAVGGAADLWRGVPRRAGGKADRHEPCCGMPCRWR